MKVIGLTGSIGTGKSSVSKILNEDYNIPIIDADKISKEAVQKGSRGLNKIKDVFGSDYILDNGELNRPKMASLVFNDEKARLALNNIVHPEVTDKYNYLVNKYKQRDEKYVIYDCPLLIEEKLNNMVDVVMLVYTSLDIQIKRIMLRDNVKKEQALMRIKAQMSTEDKMKYADIIIDNSSDFNNLKKNINKIYNSEFSKNNTCINMH